MTIADPDMAGPTMTSSETTDLAKNVLRDYAHVRDSGRAASFPVSGAFWQELAEGRHPELDHGRLLSAFSFCGPWASWERHPAGEELVLLLHGACSLTIETEGGLRTTVLDTPGDYVLVPRGAWHTASAEIDTTLIFLTPGAGTEHRPITDQA
jgi:mannose-6-phosphate isomerase-like protein (cupin superfamily)